MAARRDYNLVVVGAGSAGLVAAYLGSALKAKVALIERERMGGDCLNTGCVPSKALIRTARLLSQIRHAERVGLGRASAQFDFATAMARVRSVIARIAPHDSVERYTALGVDCFDGHATLRSAHEVQVGERTITTRAVILATGAAPHLPDLTGLCGAPYSTSETIWSLDALPERLLVLGGGPIGCELAQCFQRLGSRVTLVQRGERLLPKEDPDAAEAVLAALRADEVDVRLGHTACAFTQNGGKHSLVCRTGDDEVHINFDHALIALGRRARTTGYGLESLGIPVAEDGTIATDEYLRTVRRNVYACGDAAGPYQYTHAAAHQAWYAAVNALFSPWKKFAVDYGAMPRCTFTDPEIAHVGLNEIEARSARIPYEVTRYDLAQLDRAIIEGTDHGYVKVLTAPRKDRILGATIVGAHAGEMLGEWTLALKHGLGLNAILRTIHPYPTFGEANKHLAGRWRANHVPAWLSPLLERFHRWRR